MAAVTILANPEALAVAAAKQLTALLEEEARFRTPVFLGLTGGRTPQRLYQLLADPSQPFRSRIPWQHVCVIWSDERHVPPDHPTSNFGMADKALLQHVPIPPAQVYRMAGEMPDAQAAARAYETTLKKAFVAAGRRDSACDVLLLGIGEDAHIASIFPGSMMLDGDEDSVPGEPDPNVTAVWAQHLRASRITLTPAAILNARSIVVLASGAAKAAAVEAAIEKPLNVHRWPAQLLREAGTRVTWMVDEAAAALLSHGGQPA